MSIKQRMVEPEINDSRENFYRERAHRYGRKFPQYDPPSVELLLNLIYTYNVVETYLKRRLAELDLSLSAFNALMILNRSEGKGCPMHEIGQLLLVTRANVTGLVDSLEKRGLVERLEDSNDRRIRIARITDRGDALLESILPDHYARMKRMFDELNDQDKTSLNQLLPRVRHSVQRLAQRELNREGLR